MLQHIRKRDGRLVEFEVAKISAAIKNAVRAVGGHDMAKAETIASQVVGTLSVIFKGNQVPTVENVQDLVEKELIEAGHARTAKAYILYRQQREQLRATKSFMQESIEAIDSYLTQEDWRVKENANMGYSLQGLNNHIASNITSNYWLNKIYPESIAEAHKKGDYHIHDLGMLSVYCCGWDLKDLLLQGFTGAYGKVQSAPAKHFRTALGQMVNFFYTLQGEAAGAQAFASVDTLLAPFIRFDSLTYAEVKQSMQEFVFNMNVPTRVGFQTPFTNITLDMTVPRNMAHEGVIVGGVVQDAAYAEFQAEMDMFNKAFCEVMMDGDSSGRIFTFPIPTYNITSELDWESDRLQAVWEMTAKYGTPYFSNFINSDMNPEDARSMCCRLRLDNRELRRRGGGLFGSNPLTGSTGVVTLNLPRAAYLASDKDAFFARIGELMDLAADSLEIKRKQLERFTADGLYPYSKYYLSGIHARQGRYWDNHFSTIGLIGMHEAACNLVGCGIDSPEGHEFAQETLKYMRTRLENLQDKTGHMYNLEATPAEGTSFRLAQRDRDEFSDIHTSGTEQPYYTNSTQLPVG
ncbi:MAG: ribonucleoside triphosphate reductase, partial [Desulfuromonadaceae bacterium]